ncbi:MAG: zinc ribbon domain-containing protein [Candidatus Zixiibacteriota bacterium]|nr:MAG: zinc ribbon domain-containing protein [candidate division Zixibacteria bacterium]
MPLFEFQCKECEHKFEELVTNDAELVKCPKCKSNNVAKLLSTFSASASSSGSISGGTQSSSQCSSGFS